MKPQTVKMLQDTFQNKICTVLTLGINKVQNNQFFDYFTCMIDSINEDGVMGRHPITKCKQFFPINSIAGILEEQEIKEDHPNYSEILEEVKNSPEITNSPFINQEMMANLVLESKKKMAQKN